MATRDIQIRIIDSAKWKLKILNAVCRFLNWMTIPNSARKEKKGTLVINVTLHIEVIK